MTSSAGDYRAVNEEAWRRLAAARVESSQPWDSRHFPHAWAWLDPDGWLPWSRITSVLCLAAGGGQQGPLFAVLGRKVTVADLSSAQLVRDRRVAHRHGLELETVELDMLDLSPLAGRKYDLVWQAVSSLYIPDVRRLYDQVASVLRPGGLYRVEHCHPTPMQLSPDRAWDGEAYRIVRETRPLDPVEWHSPAGDGHAKVVCWHYPHSLEDLLGGLGDAGFVIRRYAERSAPEHGAEPGSYGHLSRYLPSFLRVLAELEPGAIRSGS